MIRILLLTCLFAFCGCSSKPPAEHVLKVGASPTPHAIILNSVKGDLKKEGIDLQIIEIDDYNIPNRSLADKELDANYFQHEQFLQQQIDDYHYCLVPIAKIHIEPMGLYSHSLSSLSDVPYGAKIAIPNDPSNEKRALQLLEKAGLISLKQSNKASTIQAISKNPKQLQFLEIDAALLPRILDDVSLAAIPTNYALQADLSPSKDALVHEDASSPYVNVLVVRCGDETKEDLQKLKAALTSDKVRQFILNHFHGEIVPAF
jgi:D-methionine transport system substrate-binding protein